MLDLAATLAGHVRTIAQQVTALAGDAPEQAMTSAFAALLRGRQSRFPALTAAIDSAAGHGSQGQALEFGLSRILDGVELLINSRG